MQELESRVPVMIGEIDSRPPLPLAFVCFSGVSEDALKHPMRDQTVGGLRWNCGVAPGTYPASCEA